MNFLLLLSFIFLVNNTYASDFLLKKYKWQEKDVIFDKFEWEKFPKFSDELPDITLIVIDSDYQAFRLELHSSALKKSAYFNAIYELNTYKKSQRIFYYHTRSIHLFKIILGYLYGQKEGTLKYDDFIEMIEAQEQLQIDDFDDLLIYTLQACDLKSFNTREIARILIFTHRNHTRLGREISETLLSYIANNYKTQKNCSADELLQYLKGKKDIIQSIDIAAQKKEQSELEKTNEPNKNLSKIRHKKVCKKTNK